ncbi:MAG: hypothetical protein JO000_27000 [Alphaproteobacteria bacterium]|nr:hypothetical protein [Alphaproteobacteria bacterium]
MLRNLTRLSALLAVASVGVFIVATTSAEAYVRRGGVGVGRVGSGVGYRPGIGVGRAGVAGWRNGAGVGYRRDGYRGLGYGAAALTGAAIGYGAANAYGYGNSYGYGYPAADVANTGFVSSNVAATPAPEGYYGGGAYGGSGGWNEYAPISGIRKCVPGSTIQMQDGVTYLCQ